jgi:hypothetical protein
MGPENERGGGASENEPDEYPENHGRGNVQAAPDGPPKRRPRRTRKSIGTGSQSLLG